MNITILARKNDIVTSSQIVRPSCRKNSLQTLQSAASRIFAKHTRDEFAAWCCAMWRDTGGCMHAGLDNGWRLMTVPIVAPNWAG